MPDAKRSEIRATCVEYPVLLELATMQKILNADGTEHPPTDRACTGTILWRTSEFRIMLQLLLCDSVQRVNQYSGDNVSAISDDGSSWYEVNR